jgi:hypothetical protein
MNGAGDYGNEEEEGAEQWFGDPRDDSISPVLAGMEGMVTIAPTAKQSKQQPEPN